jgi:hypothetical protein
MLHLSRGVVAVALLWTIGVTTSNAYAIDWHENYEDAHDEAQRTGKPMFIAFRCAP